MSLQDRQMLSVDGVLKVVDTDKEEIAIDRIRTLEPPAGYYVAFSGGGLDTEDKLFDE